jgi:MOSC domain-containing protein YiiM
VDLRDAVVGERWKVGSALLEVAQPRLPCFKLGIRMGDAHFPKRFMRVGRMGAYFRIIEEGDVAAGDTVRIEQRPDHGITLAFMVEALDDPEKALKLRVVERLPAFWRKVAGTE